MGCGGWGGGRGRGRLGGVDGRTLLGWRPTELAALLASDADAARLIADLRRRIELALIVAASF